MRFLRKLGWMLLVVITLLFISTAVFIYTHKPTYDGELSFQGIDKEVEVYYDTYGIPHIYAQNEIDAMQTLGYVHAQDRLWQMEVLRRIGSGGLSELFGKDLVRTDRFFLALGIDDASVAAIDKLNHNSRSVTLAEAYLTGINSFIEEGPTPIEFYLTGVDKREFELRDVYNIMGYMSFSFAMAHKTDPLLTKIKDKLGNQYLEDLAIGTAPDSEWIRNAPLKTDTITENTMASVMKSLEKLSIPLFEGSNSWVLGPAKTKNGKVIFANDPHIGFSQPSVWYEAHINTPEYEKYGYYIGGMPFPLLAHDRTQAYGLTMFENDDVDFFYEVNHPSDSMRYKTATGWANYEWVSKSIRVKDGEAVDFKYKKTHRGPVMNGIADQVNGEMPISMWWEYTQGNNQVIDALYQLSHTRGIDDFPKALEKIHAPGLNVMYGDAKGNISWWATAHLYRIADSVHTKFVQTPGSGLSTEKEYLDFTENPQAINPPWNYVYSANNQPDSIAGMLYPGYYLPENRAKRIVQLLAPRNDWDATAVSAMMVDVTSAVTPVVAANLVNAVDLKEVAQTQIALLDRMKAWQGTYDLESVEATVYSRWIYFVLKNTFSDELGASLFAEYLATHMHKRAIAPIIANPASVWWDDVATTDKKETQQEIVQRSFEQTLTSLELDFGSDMSKWTWDRVHTLEHGHPIGKVAALRSFFNVGPFPAEGSREVINNMAFGYSGSGFYEVTSGPSTRRVIDFSDVENSVSIIPTGQSGNPLSKHYKDQAEMYRNGEFRKMMLNTEEIKSVSESVLRFIPRSD